MAGALSFANARGGVASVQTRIGMLYAEGVRKGRLSLSRFVKVTATNPAKLFGLRLGRTLHSPLNSAIARSHSSRAGSTLASGPDGR